MHLEGEGVCEADDFGFECEPGRRICVVDGPVLLDMWWALWSCITVIS